MNTSLEALTNDLTAIADEWEKIIGSRVKDTPEAREAFEDWRDYYRTALKYPDNEQARALVDQAMHKLFPHLGNGVYEVSLK